MEVTGSKEEPPMHLLMGNPLSPGHPDAQRVDDDNLASFVTQALDPVTASNYLGLHARYEEYCRSCNPPRQMDSAVSMATFLCRGVALGTLTKPGTIHTYLKTFSALGSRLGWKSHPLRVGLPRDVLNAMNRLVGSRDARGDVFQAPTYDEVVTLATTLVAQGHLDTAVFVLVAWLTAARVKNLLSLRVCDVIGSAVPLYIVFPDAKTDRERLGLPNVIPVEDVAQRLLQLSRSRLEASGGRTGTRLWDMTREQVLAQVRAADCSISTSRAYRRGLITNALSAEEGLERHAVAIVSHHKDLEVMLRYSLHPPVGEQNQQRTVVRSALRQ